MIKFWALRIKMGKATLDDVPEKLRAQVAAEIEKVVSK